MYKIKMLCFDSNFGVPPYEDEPQCENQFETRDEAINFAFELAEQECEYLNDGADEGISFGVVVDEDGTSRVNYYYNEPYDTTGNTEQVTVYFVVEI